MKDFIVGKILPVFIGLVFIAVGLVFSVNSGKVANEYKELTTQGIQTTAKVTDANYTLKKESKSKTGSGSSNRSSTTEKLTYSYTATNGKTYTIVKSHKLKGSKVEIGSTKNVYYDKANPKKAVFEDGNPSTSMRIMGIIFIIGGLISCSIVALPLIRSRRLLTGTP